MNDQIGDLFARIGNSEHPRGAVTTAYRNARRAMASALQETDRARAAREVMGQLQTQLTSSLLGLFGDAQGMGADESAKQLRYYEIRSRDTQIVSVTLSTELHSAVDAVTAKVEAQEKAITALIVTGADDTEIIGDDNRTGVLTGGEVIAGAAYWGAALVWDAFDYWTSSYSSGMTFQKQAVAALDARTTDCCLRVHGQVQPIDGLFKLTGTPRFADEMDWPAFHWYCRTSGVLYLPGFDDGLTAQMRDGADYFLRERAAGRNPDRDPANAF